MCYNVVGMVTCITNSKQKVSSWTSRNRVVVLLIPHTGAPIPTSFSNCSLSSFESRYLSLGLSPNGKISTYDP